jgi:sensor c-di-GMP phosphodiesterase-like protein
MLLQCRIWLIRPVPMGLLIALLSAGLLLWGSWHLARGQALNTELYGLRVLHDKSRVELSRVSNELSGAADALERLDLAACTPKVLDELSILRRQFAYINEIRYQPKQGPHCLLVQPLPDFLALNYKRFPLNSGRTLWWHSAPVDPAASAKFFLPLPSLVLESRGLLLSSSLVYLHDVLSMPTGIQAYLVDSNNGTGMIIGSFAEFTTTMPLFEDVFFLDDENIFFRGEPGPLGLTLLLRSDRRELDRLTRNYSLMWFGLAGPFSILLGCITTLRLRRDQSLKHALRMALLRNELEVDYQPIIDLHSGRCLGAEALVRWRRADGLRVRPDLFIPQAEDSGQICAITRRVISLVCREQGQLLRQQPHLYISVNLAAADIRDGHFAAHAEQCMQQHAIAPAQLLYEVTERGLVDVELAVSQLQALRDKGHRIAIDDFGTGYSSLSYLHKLPIDVLKIDKSFVDTLGTDAASNSVAPHIIGMAHELGLKVIAEGIEQEAQAAVLRALGAQMGQGWLFAKAMSAADFRAFVATHG